MTALERVGIGDERVVKKLLQRFSREIMSEHRPEECVQVKDLMSLPFSGDDHPERGVCVVCMDM